jgi:hypothetical protein
MVIIQKRTGQLGNQLFSMAHFAAAAIEHDFWVSYPCFQYPIGHFPNINLEPRFKVKQSCDRLNRLRHKGFKLIRILAASSPWHECHLAEGIPFKDIGSDDFVAAARKKIVACEGFGFRDAKSVMKHRNRLVEMFSFSEAIKKEVETYKKQHNLEKDVVIVGFHVRRSDYRTYRNGEYYYGDEAWRNWINQARSLFDVGYKRYMGVIFSDEKVDGLLGTNHDLIYGPSSIYEDMMMLSECDYIVGPPSTFSGWASFIGHVPRIQLDTAKLQIEQDSFKVVNW